MIPRDWRLVLRGYARATAGARPSFDPPTQAEHDELIRKYG